MGLHEEELSILIVNDERIREINAEYRDKDKPTNVLSFPMREGDPPYISPLLGDIVISAETNQREADEADITFDERLSQLIIHGILHLVGYDHEISEAEADRMEEKSLKLLRLIESNTGLEAF